MCEIAKMQEITLIRKEHLIKKKLDALKNKFQE